MELKITYLDNHFFKAPESPEAFSQLCSVILLNLYEIANNKGLRQTTRHEINSVILKLGCLIYPIDTIEEVKE